MSDLLSNLYLPLEYTWLAIVGIYFLWLGVKGLRTRRPLLFPGRRLVWILVPGLIVPQLINGLANISSTSPYLSNNYFPFITAAFWTFWGALMWYQLSGYTVMGVRGDSLR